ncbi:hypothetical protein Hanom_Chr07g00586051 [Helianthus anomalus]
MPKTTKESVKRSAKKRHKNDLQKYMLYLKRMQGLSNERPSSSDHLFALTPVP